MMLTDVFDAAGRLYEPIPNSSLVARTGDEKRGLGVVASRDFADIHIELVRAFLRLISQAWKLSLAESTWQND
jgi:hypothetical protein